LVITAGKERKQEVLKILHGREMPGGSALAHPGEVLARHFRGDLDPTRRLLEVKHDGAISYDVSMTEKGGARRLRPLPSVPGLRPAVQYSVSVHSGAAQWVMLRARAH
jgi:hypothetical protein